MKRIVLLHTVRQMYLTFEKRLRSSVNCEIKIDNMLDSFFVNDSNERGYFSQRNLDRLYLELKSAELTGADAIAVICSALSPHVEKIKPLISVPVFRIDEKLGSEAIRHGDRIMILASASSAIEPTTKLISTAAQNSGRKVIIESKYDSAAFDAMMSGDMKTHDERIIKMGEVVKDNDAIVFAQGSMEHTAADVANASGLPVVTAPELCLQQIREFVEAP